MDSNVHSLSVQSTSITHPARTLPVVVFFTKIIMSQMEVFKRKKISKGVFWILLHKFVSKGDGNRIRGKRLKLTTNCHLVEA